MRSDLVFVRAGDDSLHLEWIRDDPARTWDCFVSYYGPEDRSEFGGEYFARGGINKFQHLKALAAERPDLFSAYDYVWAVDPDIHVEAGDISRLFSIARAHGLDLAQPSLTPHSHVSHRITLHNPNYRLRRTNFVEVMCPVFSRTSLQTCMSSFEATQSTWGLDYLWPTLLGVRARIAVIDDIQVCHVKPVDTQNGAWYRYLRKMGVDPREELERVVASLNRNPGPPKYYPYRSEPREGRNRLTALLRTRFPRLFR
jgi:hypothetical protein